MFKNISKILTAALFCSLILMSGCITVNNGDSSSNSGSSVSQQGNSENSDNGSSSNEESYNNSDSPSELSSYVSDNTVSVDESDISVDSSDEETPDDSSAAQVSFDGYQFDDEQIVDDYHTAKVFTSNDTFNEIFAENSLDKEYNTEQQNAGTSSQMRQITAKYSAKWKDKVSEIFEDLDSMLSDRAEEHEKLLQSQDEWISGLGEVENSFYSEADGAGTEALIAAEAAVMNYYKGRAAVLLEQIYELNGEINLSSYDL